jgi:hypothetical protein
VNLIPLGFVLLNDLSVFYFLYYYIFEALLFAVMSVLKLYKIFRLPNESPFSALLASVLFMGLKVSIIALPLLFLFAIAAPYYPSGDFRLEEGCLPILEEPVLFSVSFLKVLIHHLLWIKSKKYKRYSIKRFLYLSMIQGAAGFMAIFLLANIFSSTLTNNPLLVASLFTLVILLYELWDEFSEKQWLFGAKS